MRGCSWEMRCCCDEGEGEVGEGESEWSYLVAEGCADSQVKIGSGSRRLEPRQGRSGR
jgi:hypothetical protein